MLPRRSHHYNHGFAMINPGTGVVVFHRGILLSASRHAGPNTSRSWPCSNFARYVLLCAFAAVVLRLWTTLCVTLMSLIPKCQSCPSWSDTSPRRPLSTNHEEHDQYKPSIPYIRSAILLP